MFLGSLLVLFLFLTIRVAPQTLIFVSRYSVVLFFIVLALYYVTFRLPGKAGWVAGLSLTMVLFAGVLLFKWSSGYTDSGIIGGLLPYKDGRNYYWGTQLLMNGYPISAASDQAAGRPLFPGFLSIFLFLTGQNYQWALALIAGLTGFSAYLSARPMLEKFSALAASIYITLLYFYIQPLIGRPLSEFPGFIFGCLSFVLLWRSATKLSLIDLILGLFTLMMAISIRAGAFFVFPLLILWAGWVFRGEKRYSLKVAGVAFLTVGIAFILMNVLYPRWVVVPEGITNANFAYALYGQVRGGIGYNAGIKDLGTKDPAVAYQAAFDFFTRHPLSFFVAATKSYRDFFLPNRTGILPLRASQSELDSLSTGVWILGLFFLAVGLVNAIRNFRYPLYSLFVTVFAGVMLSIPFLPPIDGGRDFYASTIPFVYAPICFAPLVLFRYPIQTETHVPDHSDEFERIFPTLLVILTMLCPILLRLAITPGSYTAPTCPTDQEPFVTRIYPHSYVEIMREGAPTCGFAPSICVEDFQQFSQEKSSDDLYQELERLAEATTSSMRIIPSVDLVDSNFHYLVDNGGFLDGLGTPPLSVQGCAIEIKTKTQSIYQITMLGSVTTP